MLSERSWHIGDPEALTQLTSPAEANDPNRHNRRSIVRRIRGISMQSFRWRYRRVRMRVRQQYRRIRRRVLAVHERAQTSDSGTWRGYITEMMKAFVKAVRTPRRRQRPLVRVQMAVGLAPDLETHPLAAVVTVATEAEPAVRVERGDDTEAAALRVIADDGTRPIALEPIDVRAVNPMGFPLVPSEPDELVLRVLDPDAEVLREAARREFLAFHGGQVDDARRWAATIVRLAAKGIPIVGEHVEGQLADLLGPALSDAIRTVDPGTLADPVGRARASVRQRRAALRDHSARAFWRSAMRDERGLVTMPSVSVLLATRRPQYLIDSLDMIRNQTYGNVEVLVGLHGSAWEPAHRAAIADRAGDGVRSFDFPDDMNLGAVLDDLARRADGVLLTKWDDDDWYCRHHIDDLAAALDYSGAAIVGKAAEFVMLEGRNELIHRHANGGESWTSTIAGGTLMLEKAALIETGGWPHAPRRVDQLLIEQLGDHDGSPYRTHGFGYVLRRAGADHTWVVDEDYFTRAASDRRTGLDLEFAGFDTGTAS